MTLHFYLPDDMRCDAMENASQNDFIDEIKSMGGKFKNWLFPSLATRCKTIIHIYDQINYERLEHNTNIRLFVDEHWILFNNYYQVYWKMFHLVYVDLSEQNEIFLLIKYSNCSELGITLLDNEQSKNDLRDIITLYDKEDEYNSVIKDWQYLVTWLEEKS